MALRDTSLANTSISTADRGTLRALFQGRAVRDKFAGAQPKFRRKNISRLVV